MYYGRGLLVYCSPRSDKTRVSLNQYTAGSGFQAGIMVRFGQYDIAYFGFYQGATLRLERSGQVNLAQVSNSAATVWLRVSKKGSNYTFAYKTTASGNWIDLSTQTWSTTPTHVGMIVKTWTATAVKADFDHFSLVSEIRQDLEYTYDTVGNIKSINDKLVPETLTYSYDALYRLTGVSGGMNESYEYSAASGNLNKKNGVSYTYPASVSNCANGQPSRTIPHAVSAMGGNTYLYDCNGNMKQRTISGQTYTLSYDQENHLTGVSGAATATFAYDGDGNRVKSVEGGVTTVYIGSHYEWTSAGNTRYYYAGGQRVAMRREGYSSYNGLYYLVSDHLGSTSLVLNTSGTIVQQTKYKPWGEIRSGDITVTTYGFTGQRETGFGLMYFVARHYDAALGRFTQPDSIIPNPGDPASWDRFSYVRNSPLNFVDPTGHFCIGKGNNQICSADYDSNMWWSPIKQDPADIFVNEMRVPTDGGTVNTKFGAINTFIRWDEYSGNREEDYKKYGAHAAVDISDADTENIYAVYDGVIVSTRSDQGGNGGNVIVIEHSVGDEKFYSYYFHLLDDPTEKKGEKVMAGEVIGIMGQSGGTSSVHLHFEVRTQAGYEASWEASSWWANNPQELHQNWVDISILFGGYDSNLPEDWYY